MTEGDILIEYDGQVITRSSGLFKLLTPEKINRPVRLKLLRKGAIVEMEIIPKEKP
jgi:S1-C subfamily serine protease